MKIWLKIVVICFLYSSCSENEIVLPNTYQPTPLPLEIPPLFAEKILDPVIPFNNPQTVEGVALGRKIILRPYFIW